MRFSGAIGKRSRNCHFRACESSRGATDIRMSGSLVQSLLNYSVFIDMNIFSRQFYFRRCYHLVDENFRIFVVVVVDEKNTD